MRITISEIREGTDSIDFSIQPEDLGLKYPDTLFEAPVKVNIESHRTGLEITLIADVETNLGLVCARCLKKFDYEFKSTVELHLKAQKGGVRDVDFVDDDFAFIDKDMGIIDLEERIREEIILGLPRIPRCSEECPGIEYGAEDESIDPRWKVLKKLKQHKEVENGSSKEKK